MKQILYIVEDNRIMREFLMNLFSPEYELRVFDTGQKALAELESGSIPNLVMLDYGLEGYNGYDLLSKIRSNSELNHLPVVFLSGERKSDVKIKCLKDGAYDFINKPFNPIELKIRVSKAIANASGMSKVSA